MTAHDILLLSNSDGSFPAQCEPVTHICAEDSVFALLPQIGESASACVDVVDGSDKIFGRVNAESILRALSMMLRVTPETSWVELRIPAIDYSASLLARAVEDVDAHLLDIITTPEIDNADILHVSILVSHTDPTAVVHSLERLGIETLSSMSTSSVDYQTARERLSQLQLYLNI